MGCYIYNGIRFKSKDDLINGLDIDVAVDLFRKWKDCNDDFKSWLEDILPKNISKNISNNLQCSEFWQLIFADNKDKPHELELHKTSHAFLFPYLDKSKHLLHSL